MRNVLLMCSLLFSITTKAQSKNDNTITVNKPVSLSSLKMILFNNGYNQENSDSTFITTTAKSMKTNSVCRLMIARTDSGVIIKGQGKMSSTVPLFGITSDNEFMQVEYSKFKTSMAYEWFAEMNKIADAIGGTKVFSKQ